MSCVCFCSRPILCIYVHCVFIVSVSPVLSILIDMGSGLVPEIKLSIDYLIGQKIS